MISLRVYILQISTLIVICLTLSSSIAHATLMYSPYVAFSNPFSHRLNQNFEQRVPVAPRPLQYSDLTATVVNEHSHRLPRLVRISSNPADDTFAEKEKREIRSHEYGWEQCEFSPLSCLIRRRRK